MKRSSIFILVNPLLPFAIEPHALAFDSIGVLVNSDAALLSFNPSAFVLTAILPCEFALTVALVLFELPDVLFSIRPDKVTASMHFVLEPLSLVLLVVTPDINA